MEEGHDIAAVGPCLQSDEDGKESIDAWKNLSFRRSPLNYVLQERKS